MTPARHRHRRRNRWISLRPVDVFGMLLVLSIFAWAGGADRPVTTAFVLATLVAGWVIIWRGR